MVRPPLCWKGYPYGSCAEGRCSPGVQQHDEDKVESRVFRGKMSMGRKFDSAHFVSARRIKADRRRQSLKIQPRPAICVQIRSKIASARGGALTRQAAKVIASRKWMKSRCLWTIVLMLSWRRAKQGLKLMGFMSDKQIFPWMFAGNTWGKKPSLVCRPGPMIYLSISKQPMFLGLIISAPDRCMKPRRNPIAGLIWMEK